MAMVGYARVSSVGQSLDVQLEKLTVCQKIFKEKKSGTSDKRPELKACLDYIREGDTLVITRLDRLARSTLHLCQIADTLTLKKVDLQVIDQNINTSDATGRLLFNMLGAIAQFVNEIRAERQHDGITKARKLSKDALSRLKEQRAEGTLIKDLMKAYDLSKASIYRLMKEETTHESDR
jgi:DNA invertase Pin-like site-specific DNA recombinase